MDTVVDTCKKCEEKFDRLPDLGPGRGEFCDECIEHYQEYASTWFKFTPGGFTDLRYARELDDTKPEPLKEETWNNSGGWSGYTDWKLKKGYIELADGWVTGSTDETTERKVELADVFEKLQEGKLTPPCDIWWAFGVTSNIWSTASTMIIRSKDEAVAKAWIEEINGTNQEWQKKFD